MARIDRESQAESEAQSAAPSGEGAGAMTNDAAGAAIGTMEALASLAARATRHETPCGDGAMVWHRWGTGSPVVLLHGGSGSWTHWLRNIDALTHAGRSVWVPDLPGFGDSARPASASDADDLPAPVEDGLAALLGDAACDLVGFSFGAMVAGFIAARRPLRVRHLVLVGAPALGIDPVHPILLRGWTHLPPGPQRDAVMRANLNALMVARPESIDAFTLALQAHNVARDRMKRRRLSRTPVLRETLRGVAAPVSGIWGSEDALYTGRIGGLEAALRSAPRFRSLQIVESAGHWVQFEAAGAFDTALGRVLAEPLD